MATDSVQQATLLAAIGVVAFLAGGKPELPLRLLLRVSGFAALLIALPFILSDQAHGVNDVTRVAIFAATPVIVVLAMGLQRSDAAGQQFLLPAVAALGGLLFVLPVNLQQAPYMALSLGLMLVASGAVALASAFLPGHLGRMSFRSAVVLICFPNSLLLLLYGGVGGRAMLHAPSAGAVWTGALNLLQVGLLVWLLQRMQPQRLAVRFILAPLLTAAEGYLLLHGELTGRMVFGTLVASVSAAYLLFARPSDKILTLSLR